MLSRRKKEELKEWFTQRLSELLENTKDPLVDIYDFKDRFRDQTDQAFKGSEMGLTVPIRDWKLNLMRKISEALRRLENGTFGTFKNCGDEIATKRLMERPITTLCIDCDTDEEISQKLPGQGVP